VKTPWFVTSALEALGAIATEECDEVLRQHVSDSVRVVSDSCVVALDMSEYEHTGQFQYADGLQKVSKEATA
jgi:deoxyhypusine monooxygenase